MLMVALDIECVGGIVYRQISIISAILWWEQVTVDEMRMMSALY